ncbi:hypothetical protein [Streptococcus merionis]|uniref:hypothetical protein n=1 Tax=Streptococcus merionis TaxID=400065 RepID=UPI00037B28D4|nr:hypothetical protein [Streptococcus merionis]
MVSLKKKTTRFKKQNPEKVRPFLTVLPVLAGLSIVYIDETIIDTYLYRKHGRSKREKKVIGKISGRRFERMSIVAGQVGGRFVASMVYKQSMTSQFFIA